MKKRKMLLQTVVVMSIASLFASVSAAENNHEHDDADKTEISSTCGEHKQKMHQHMKKMQETMQQIHSETDMEKRKQLMNDHHKKMMEGMGMMSGHDNNHEKKGMMGKKEMMMKCPGMMEHKMDMMTSMMEQMMQHQHEGQKSEVKGDHSQHK
jgi:hypothetical protein